MGRIHWKFFRLLTELTSHGSKFLPFCWLLTENHLQPRRLPWLVQPTLALRRPSLKQQEAPTLVHYDHLCPILLVRRPVGSYSVNTRELSKGDNRRLSMLRITTSHTHSVYIHGFNQWEAKVGKECVITEQIQTVVLVLFPKQYRTTIHTTLVFARLYKLFRDDLKSKGEK